MLPAGALGGLADGGVLVLAGGQGGLLGQFDPLDRGGRASVLVLETPGEFLLLDPDRASPDRPCVQQFDGNPDDLADGPPSRLDRRTRGEPETQLLEPGLEVGVVLLGGIHARLVERVAVDGQPGAVVGLDLVRDRDVRM